MSKSKKKRPAAKPAEDIKELKAPVEEAPVEEAPVEEAPAVEAEEAEAPQESDAAQVIEQDSAPAVETAGGEAAAVAEEPKPPLKQFLGKAKKFLDDIGIPDMLLVRFVAVYFLFSGFLISAMRENYAAVDRWQDFIKESNRPKYIMLGLVAFILLTIIHDLLPKRYRIVDQSAAIASIIFFDIEALWRISRSYAAISFILVSLVFIYYCLGKLPSRKLYNKVPWWISGLVVLIAAGLVCFFVALTTVYKHKTFGTACHDFGLFVQMYHSLAENFTAVTTSERDYTISHFLVHASYIFYALVPVYKLFPYAETLLICQAILAMGGVIPLFLIAKRHNFKGISLLFMGLAYVFCVCLISPCYYEFHENAFLPTLLMWLLWAVDGKKIIPFYVFSVLVCIVKEDAPLYVVCIAMFMFFRDKGSIKRLHGIIMAALAGAYMVLITNYLTEHGDGQMMTSTRFGNLMIDPNGGLAEVIKNSLSDPAYFFTLFIQEHSLEFFIQVMLPMLFLPFFTKKIHRFLLMLPFVIMNMVIGAGYGYACNIGFQYIFGPACLLLYMCIINLEDLSAAKKHDLPILMGTAAIILTIGTQTQSLTSYENYKTEEESGSKYFSTLEAMIQTVPKDASLAIDTWLLPHAANRDKVYLFDNSDIDLYNADQVAQGEAPFGAVREIEKYDYFIISENWEYYNLCTQAFSENGIHMVDEIPGRIAVFKSDSYNG